MNRDPVSPDQQAAQWLARDDLDRSPGREAFAAWLEAHADHRDAWARANRVWDVFDRADDSDLIAAMARAARQAGPAPLAAPLWPKLVAACAAVIVVSALLLTGARQGWFGPQAGPAEVATNAAPSLNGYGPPDYVTGVGQTSVVDLPDGTRVTLDAESALDVVYTQGRRNVRLTKGHAFFDVAHDPAQPFAVKAAGRLVTALGTQFDVRLAQDGLRVVLAEGSVSVALASAQGAAAPVKLAPGQAFTVEGGGAGKVSPTDVDQALAWKQGTVEFRDQPLSEAIKLLNRSTRAQIVIRDPKVASLRITGVFKTGDVKRFGRSVSQVLPVRMIARDADTYELVSARR